MDYVLVENKTTVLWGALPWRHRFIQSELNDLEIDYTVSPTEPNSYIKINDSIEIFPVVEKNIPEHDGIYEELAGPFWNFENNVAKATYVKQNRNIDVIKGDLKNIAAAERYRKEISGTKTTIQGVEVTIDTTRETRNIFIQKYSIMDDTEVVQWKFPETWLTLTKQELKTVIDAGASYIQTQFDWEKSIADEIDSKQYVDDLKQIIIVPKPGV